MEAFSKLVLLIALSGTADLGWVPAQSPAQPPPPPPIPAQIPPGPPLPSPAPSNIFAPMPPSPDARPHRPLRRIRQRLRSIFRPWAPPLSFGHRGTAGPKTGIG